MVAPRLPSKGADAHSLQIVCLDADGVAAVESLRAELAQAKEQARRSDAAASRAAEELEGDGRNGREVKRCYRPQ